MNICRNCSIPMTGVMSFSKDKREKFDKCPKCHGKTKHQKIKDDKLTFGEVLTKAITNRK